MRTFNFILSGVLAFFGASVITVNGAAVPSLSKADTIDENIPNGYLSLPSVKEYPKIDAEPELSAKTEHLAAPPYTTRDVSSTDNSVYERDVLEKRLIHFRRVVNLTLKHAVHGAVGSFKWVITVAFDGVNTLQTQFLNGESSTGTSFHTEHFEIDQKFSNGVDGVIQGAFLVDTPQGDFRLRLRWEEFLSTTTASINEVTNSWCAFLLPGGEEGLTQGDFSFTMKVG
ncbi:hypothetical protein B0J12DRAFT_705959 [Macrophomina phaseolina]|uniref:Secreted protein n=1 Tax=Macrophomina phaseolina TaxID=35725 RepID=A0ABQ8FQM3_9PEZI|nr:hypothetical protein B0J12DRAFT_705959 [Macrophomina phaseolina]